MTRNLLAALPSYICMHDVYIPKTVNVFTWMNYHGEITQMNLHCREENSVAFTFNVAEVLFAGGYMYVLKYSLQSNIDM